MDQDIKTSRDDTLEDLRRSVARLERGGRRTSGGAISLCPAIDGTLPGGGLEQGALHEVMAAEPGAVAAFCALILGRAAGEVVWIASDPDIWPSGLITCGLSSAKVILVQAPRLQDGLWAFEETLRSPGVAGAVLIVDGKGPDLIAGRRLQLAAEVGGGVGLLVLPDTDQVQPSAARTRWRVSAMPGERSGDPAWKLELLRCAGGSPNAWAVLWNRLSSSLEVPSRIGDPANEIARTRKMSA